MSSEERVSAKRNFLILAMMFLSGSIIAFSTSCGGDDTPKWCEPGFCEDGLGPYLCKPTTGFQTARCFATDTEAFFWCQGKGGTARQPICDYNGGGETGGTDPADGSSAPDWSPSDHVVFSANLDQFEVDRTFIEELKADTSLLALDHSYVEPIDTGHYQLHNVKQGDLAYTMGLRSGDVLSNLNGFELDSLDTLLEAYDDLEYMQEFFLTVERGVDPMQFTYVIVDDR